jgi:hypothetical protein
MQTTEANVQQTQSSKGRIPVLSSIRQRESDFIKRWRNIDARVSKGYGSSNLQTWNRGTLLWSLYQWLSYSLEFLWFPWQLLRIFGGMFTSNKHLQLYIVNKIELEHHDSIKWLIINYRLYTYYAYTCKTVCHKHNSTWCFMYILLWYNAMAQSLNCRLN